MILVADSGATKTDWVLIKEDGKRPTSFSTIGLNPNYLDDKSVIDTEISRLAAESHCADQVDEVFFYGAGCCDDTNRQIIAKAVARNFAKAKIEVRTDLLGACRACCGDSDGIVGILGTGSNSCVYQNGQIVENIPSAGYMLGDEGSGTYIGKQLLKAYLTERMPRNLALEFGDSLNGLSRSQIMDRVYRQPEPNKFFASLAPFALNNVGNVFIHSLVECCLDGFFSNQIRYYHAELTDLYMVGSVAAILEEQLRVCAKKYGLELRKVLRKPIGGLVDYHSKKS